MNKYLIIYSQKCYGSLLIKMNTIFTNLIMYFIEFCVLLVNTACGRFCGSSFTITIQNQNCFVITHIWFAPVWS